MTRKFKRRSRDLRCMRDLVHVTSARKALLRRTLHRALRQVCSRNIHFEVTKKWKNKRFADGATAGSHFSQLPVRCPEE